MARESARSAVCLAHMRNFGIGLAAYAADSKGFMAGPNTSGAAIGNNAVTTGREDLAVGASRALQNIDWVSPTMGPQLGLSADPHRRLEQILNEELRCPSNETRYLNEYAGAPRLNLPGNANQFYVMSYAANLAFHVRKTGNSTFDEPVGGTDGDFAGGNPSSLGTNVAYLDIDRYPSGYGFRLDDVKNASQKAYAVEGVRFYTTNANTGMASELTYNGLFREPLGGNFMHGGFLFTGGGSPYKFGKRSRGGRGGDLWSTESTDGMSPGELADQVHPGSKLNGFRHPNTSMNMTFFDGSGHKLPVAEAVKIDYHLPSGCITKNSDESPDPNDRNGQIIR